MQHSSHHGPKEEAAASDFSEAGFHEDPSLSLKVRKKRARAARRRLLAWITTAGAACFGFFLLFALLWAHAEYRTWQARVVKRETDLAAYKKVLVAGQKRLAALQSPMGHEELLIENGYLKPGDRILQFPPEPEEAQAAARTPNDLTPHPEEFAAASPEDSTWRGVVKTLQSQWETWRGSGKPVLAAVPR